MNLNKTRPLPQKKHQKVGSTQKRVARWSQTAAFIGSLQGFAGLAREQEFVTKAANFLYFIFDKSNVNVYNDTLRFTTE